MKKAKKTTAAKPAKNSSAAAAKPAAAAQQKTPAAANKPPAAAPQQPDAAQQPDPKPDAAAAAQQPEPGPRVGVALNAKNLAIAALANNEASRFTLSGIYVTDTETVETDGAQLLAVTLPEIDLDAVPTISGFKLADTFEPFMLPRDAAIEAMKAIPKKPSLPVLAHAFVGEGGKENLQIGVTDLSSPKVLSPKRMKGNFPDHKKVVPKAEDCDLQVILNADLMARVMKAFADFADDDKLPAVRLSLWKPGMHNGKLVAKPVRFDAFNSRTGQEMYGAIAPMLRTEYKGATIRSTNFTPYHSPIAVAEPAADWMPEDLKEVAEANPVEPEEMAAMVANVRAKYKIGNPINPKWHWVEKREIRRMNIEAMAKEYAAQSGFKATAAPKSKPSSPAKSSSSKPSGGAGIKPDYVTDLTQEQWEALIPQKRAWYKIRHNRELAAQAQAMAGKKAS